MSDALLEAVRAWAARKHRAAGAGALEAVVAAMQRHQYVVSVQGRGSGALGNMCWGTDPAGLARKHRAAGAWAIEAVVAAMQAHPQVVHVQERGRAALEGICWGTGPAGMAHKHRAARAGGRTRVLVHVLSALLGTTVTPGATFGRSGGRTACVRFKDKISISI